MRKQGVPPQSKDLEERALQYLTKERSTSVDELYHALRIRAPSLTKPELTDLVWKLVEREKAGLEDIPPATNSIWQYVKVWDRNLSLYVAAVTSLATLLAVYVLPVSFPLVVLRWVLGSLFVLLIPGYVALEALFPKGRELEGIERLALCVGLSLAIVPLVGLVLNYAPWGITLDSIMICLTVLTVGLTVLAFVRRFRLSAERFELRQLG